MGDLTARQKFIQWLDKLTPQIVGRELGLKLADAMVDSAHEVIEEQIAENAALRVEIAALREHFAMAIRALLDIRRSADHYQDIGNKHRSLGTIRWLATKTAAGLISKQPWVAENRHLEGTSLGALLSPQAAEPPEGGE